MVRFECGLVSFSYGSIAGESLCIFLIIIGYSATTAAAAA
jgi:hypothetical protein